MLGMMADTCISALQRLSQKDYFEFKVNPAYIAKPCLGEKKILGRCLHG